jgi:hypothetical protein
MASFSCDFAACFFKIQIVAIAKSLTPQDKFLATALTIRNTNIDQRQTSVGSFQSPCIHANIKYDLHAETTLNSVQYLCHTKAKVYQIREPISRKIKDKPYPFQYVNDQTLVHYLHLPFTYSDHFTPQASNQKPGLMLQNDLTREIEDHYRRLSRLERMSVAVFYCSFLLNLLALAWTSSAIQKSLTTIQILCAND